MRLVRDTTILAVSTVVQRDLTLATIECVAVTAFTALATVDGLEQFLDLVTAQPRVGAVAAVDGGAVAADARGVAVVDGRVCEAGEGSRAQRAHALVAEVAALAVVAVAKC